MEKVHKSLEENVEECGRVCGDKRLWSIERRRVWSEEVGRPSGVPRAGVSVSLCVCVERFIDGASESLKCSLVQFESLLIAHIQSLGRVCKLI